MIVSIFEDKNVAKCILRCENCGNDRVRSYSEVKRFNQRIKYCKSCSVIICGKQNKISEDFYKSVVENVGYKLIIPPPHSNGKMTLLCPNGHTWNTAYTNFISGNRCYFCSKYHKKTENDYIELATTRGITYKGPMPTRSEHKTNWICRCGVNIYRAFREVRMGHGLCTECTKNICFGVNSHFFNPNLTNKEREDRRQDTMYCNWLKLIYQKFNFKCQKCFNKRNPNAHHIFNWMDYPELRRDKDNGIVLCDTCHSAFHSFFGKKNNCLTQLESFLERPIDEPQRSNLINKVNQQLILDKEMEI